MKGSEDGNLRVNQRDNGMETTLGRVRQRLNELGPRVVSELQFKGVTAQETEGIFTSSQFELGFEPHERGITDDAMWVQHPTTEVGTARVGGLGDRANVLLIPGGPLRRSR